MVAQTKEGDRRNERLFKLGVFSEGKSLFEELTLTAVRMNRAREWHRAVNLGPSSVLEDRIRQAARILTLELIGAQTSLAQSIVPGAVVDGSREERMRKAHEEAGITSGEYRILERLVLVEPGVESTDTAIGEDFNVSRHTIKNQLRNICRKSGVTERTQLAVLALRRGWVL
jgi:DNA-binding NarL/FixJ family response regulator